MEDDHRLRIVSRRLKLLCTGLIFCLPVVGGLFGFFSINFMTRRPCRWRLCLFG